MIPSDDALYGTITQDVGTSIAGAPVTGASTVEVPRMAIVSDFGFRVMVPFAPTESRAGNVAGRWVQLDRPGVEPLLEWGGRGLPMLDFELKVGWPDHRPIETLLAELAEVARRPSKVTIVGWHGLAGGTWRVTDMTIETTRLTEANQVCQALVAMQLTRASDAKVQRGTFSTVTPGTLTNAPSAMTVYGPAQPGSGSTTGTPASTKPALVEAAKWGWIPRSSLTKKWQTVADQIGIKDVRKGLPTARTPYGDAVTTPSSSDLIG